MPCYEVRTVSVEFKVSNFTLLKKAIEQTGFRISGMSEIDNYLAFRDKYGNSVKINLDTQMLSSQAYNELKLTEVGNLLKRTYSEMIIDEVAKKQKWIKKNLGKGQFQLQRF